MMELERLRYPKQYVRESVDDYTHKVRHSFGFWTSTKTRPIIISELIKAVREDVSILNDDTTMGEMLDYDRGIAYVLMRRRAPTTTGQRGQCVRRENHSGAAHTLCPDGDHRRPGGAGGVYPAEAGSQRPALRRPAHSQRTGIVERVC